MTPTEIYKETTRCTQAVLLAFGIKGYPTTCSGMLSYFTGNGFKVQKVEGLTGTKLERIPWHPEKVSMEKSYYINTSGHAIGLINGVLIDTELKGLDGRHIIGIWEIIKLDQK